MQPPPPQAMYTADECKTHLCVAQLKKYFLKNPVFFRNFQLCKKKKKNRQKMQKGAGVVSSGEGCDATRGGSC